MSDDKDSPAGDELPDNVIDLTKHRQRTKKPRREEVTEKLQEIRRKVRRLANALLVLTDDGE